MRKKNDQKNEVGHLTGGSEECKCGIENGQVISKVNWVTEHIRTAVLKYNYQIDKIDKLLIKDFTDEELNEYEKTS